MAPTPPTALGRCGSGDLQPIRRRGDNRERLDLFPPPDPPHTRSTGKRAVHHNSLVFIGFDVGTRGVRALAATESGEPLSEATAAFAAPDAMARAGPAGHHEQSPRVWWEAVCRAARALVADLEAYAVGREAFEGMAVDGTSGTLVALDARGRPLRPAMMYNDPRGAEQAEGLNTAAGDFCGKLGYRFSSSFALAKIAWLRAHEPATFAATARFAHQADYVVGRLTGRPGVTDYSNALKTGYDLVEERWPDWIDRTLGIAAKLPEVVAPATRVGTVTAEAAEATGLPQGLAVVAGASDGTAGCLASGLCRPGDYNTTLGTTLVFKAISATICRDPAGLIYSHRLPGGLWLPGAASNTGGGWTGTMFPGADLQALDAAAAQRMPGQSPAYPLVGRGERFPFRSESAEGFFPPGLAADDLVGRYAACLEGVGLLECLAYEVLDELTGGSDGEVFATGGGSRSDVWMQCRADVTGRTFHRPACPESAFGSALLAAAGTFYGDLGEAIERMVRIRRSFHPRPQRRRHYDRLFQRFRGELQARGYL